MRIRATYVLALLLMTGYSMSCSLAETKSMTGGRISPEASPQVGQSRFPLLSELRKNSIELYGRWQVNDDADLIYWVEANKTEKCLIIGDTTGKRLYEKCAAGINRVYITGALRTLDSELAFEYNEGGSDSFIQLLVYSKAKISELIREEDDNSFGAGVSIRPQFRNGINPAKEPFEITLTPYGLASPVGKTTRIFRYKDGLYSYFGEYEREKAGDFVEGIINRK